MSDEPQPLENEVSKDIKNNSIDNQRESKKNPEYSRIKRFKISKINLMWLIFLVISLSVNLIFIWFINTEFSLLSSILKEQIEINQLQNLNIKRLPEISESLEGLNQSQVRLKEEIGKGKIFEKEITREISQLGQKITMTLVDMREVYSLAEIQHLLQIALQRSYLEADPEPIIRLMRMAQAKLGQITDVRLIAVRESLEMDILTLESFEPIDIYGINARLTAATELLPQLSIVRSFKNKKNRVNNLEEKSNSERSISWLSSFQNLVRIRRVSEPIKPLVSIIDEERYREVLRLLIEQARLSLVRSDQLLFDSGIDSAISILKKAFNHETGEGKALLESLKALKNQEVSASLPITDEGLKKLKRLRQERVEEQAIRKSAKHTFESK